MNEWTAGPPPTVSLPAKSRSNDRFDAKGARGSLRGAPVRTRVGLGYRFSSVELFAGWVTGRIGPGQVSEVKTQLPKAIPTTTATRIATSIQRPGGELRTPGMP